MKGRRTRSPHSGVVLLRPDPDGRHPHWRARFVDPDSGRAVKVTLDPMAVTTAEARRDWAIRKAKALAKRRLDLDGGAHRTTGTTIAAALERYFADHPQLRSRTLEIYRRAAGKLQSWSHRMRLTSADDLTGPKLVAFRSELVKEPLLKCLEGGKRGSVKVTPEQRAPTTVNVELRAVRTVLGYLRRLGLLPRITSDDLKDGLERLPVGRARNEYFRVHELQKVLEACLRHDAATYTATREEHAGVRPVGSTERYDAIGPCIAVALLTGMRFAEVLDLEWTQIDLEALDNDGRPVGEIHLGTATKTKRARTVGLEVSPALRKLLASMHVRSGGKGKVFGPLTRGTAKASAKRLVREYGAPAKFGWQALRRTCGTYLTNAPGIFGAASAYRSAKQLGHSVAVAEKHYVDVVRGIPREARTLEAAMQIETQLQQIIAAARARAAAANSASDVKRSTR